MEDSMEFAFWEKRDQIVQQPPVIFSLLIILL